MVIHYSGVELVSSTGQSITITLSATRGSSDGLAATDKRSFPISLPVPSPGYDEGAEGAYTDPPLNPPASASSSDPPSPRPPPFSSLYFPLVSATAPPGEPVTEPDFSSLPAFAPTSPFETAAAATAEAETKAALPPDTKGDSSNKSADDGEPPPPYTEGSSPLDSFTYVMAAAGGAASIITQVQQGGPAPINTLAGWWIQRGETCIGAGKLTDTLFRRCWRGRTYHPRPTV